MLANKILSATAGSEEKLFPEDAFAVHVYTGNGSTQTINNGIDLSTHGGLVWSKSRGNEGGAWPHALADTTRGKNVCLSSNQTDGNINCSGDIASFNTNGVTYNAPTNTNYFNRNGTTYVNWFFRNAANFFTHTTVSHTNGTPTNINLSSLGTVGQVHAKITNTAGDWIVWHRSLTAGNNLRLNTTAAQSTTNAWLSVSGTTATLSASAPTGTYVIHAWAHDTSADGIIQCGSYLGGSANLQVSTGWEPQFVLVKSTSTENWIMFDSMRGVPTGGGGDRYLFPNLSNAEGANASQDFINFNSSGFELPVNSNGSTNAAGTSYIYLAIRRPNKPPTNGTQVYNAIARTGTGAAATVTGVGFPPDFVQISGRESFSGKNWVQFNRLCGGDRLLSSDNTGAEFTNAAVLLSDSLSTSMDGVRIQTANPINSASYNYINHFFKRAPGVFDVVCYTGTGVARTVNHSLGVAPELMIVKNRTGATDWGVQCQYLSSVTDNLLYLNSNLGQSASTNLWATPTSTTFGFGTGAPAAGLINESGKNYVAHLFASLPGISKVGSYTGNGGTQTINCGFTTGARFFLVKATSTTGNWWVFDSARGIISSFDPAIALNSIAAEVTSADAVDPDSSGIIVNQEATCSINATGVNYIYLAIA